MPSQVFYSKRHDTAVALPLTFTPPPGLNWDLSTAGVTIRFIARTEEDAVPRISSTSVQVTGPWTCQYKPIAADVATLASLDVEVEAINSVGDKVTLPTRGFLSWVIEPDLNDA